MCKCMLVRCLSLKQTVLLGMFITMLWMSAVLIYYASTVRQVDATITSVVDSTVYFNMSSTPCSMSSTMQSEPCDNCNYYNGTTHPYYVECCFGVKSFSKLYVLTRFYIILALFIPVGIGLLAVFVHSWRTDEVHSIDMVYVCDCHC